MSKSSIKILSVINYDNDPVYYCADCLSLKVKNINGSIESDEVRDTDFCDECGSTNIKKASISEWNELYKEKYGHYYLEENDRKNG